MIGNMICKLRMKNQYTQEELATYLNLSTSTIGMYEQNRRSPDLDTLLQLAELFHVSTDQLLGIEPYEENDISEPAAFTLGQKIRCLREKEHLTQYELAQKLFLTPKMISFYEHDQRIPPADMLIKLTQIFHVSADYLLGLEYKNNHTGKTSPSWNEIVSLFPNVALLTDEEEELLKYYHSLSLMNKRWIVGQMVDLIKKGEKSTSIQNPKE